MKAERRWIIVRVATAALLTPNHTGNYRFLASPGRPFSGGSVADAGFGLVRARFERPLPLEDGLAAACDHVVAAGRSIKAIAGIELRIPAPFTHAGFDTFNERYVSLLERMGLTIDGLIPAARTNVAPISGGVTEPSVYAFCYSIREPRDRPAFVLSGIAATQPGEPTAMLSSIITAASDRLKKLGLLWGHATAVQMYGTADVVSQVLDAPVLWAAYGAIHGLQWFPSLPPIEGLRLEVDVRATGQEVILPI